MKQLTEILNAHLKTCHAIHKVQISDKYPPHIIRAMKEAYNLAIDHCIENGEIHVETWTDLFLNNCEHTTVDKESLLKLKIK